MRWVAITFGLIVVAWMVGVIKGAPRDPLAWKPQSVAQSCLPSNTTGYCATMRWQSDGSPAPADLYSTTPVGSTPQLASPSDTSTTTTPKTNTTTTVYRTTPPARTRTIYVREPTTTIIYEQRP